MIYLKSILLALTLGLTTNVFAAIDCRPGMGGGCPTDPPQPQPPAPVDQLEIGFAEVASPDCNAADLAQAKDLAVVDAFSQARRHLNIEQPVVLNAFFYPTLRSGTLR